MALLITENGSITYEESMKTACWIRSSVSMRTWTSLRHGVCLSLCSMKSVTDYEDYESATLELLTDLEKNTPRLRVVGTEAAAG